jgi:hypothetical protein
MTANAQKTDSGDTYGLFMGALDVINASLEHNREGKIFRGLMSLAERSMVGRQIGVAVYRDDPDTPHDYFTVRFHKGRIELLARGKESPDIAWKVSQDYLQDVVENEQDYVENPAKLDLDWLKDRLGI